MATIRIVSGSLDQTISSPDAVLNIAGDTFSIVGTSTGIQTNLADPTTEGEPAS
ncbi:hypothetical protein [Humibacter ginsenosidimutans]|uniref:hypothetical protein n=1 Tax=Humibacter ginsenosidimutans TaxID=2599293 RepID=UPI00143D1492|nr:hypothetical protein [Humibacter ginsenosidimutans]